MCTRPVVGLLLASISVCFQASAQSGSDDAYQAERQQAITLFNQQKNLEALPLFEDLVKRNPDDNVALFGLGACLVNHSATLPDEDAAKKERIRARDYLLRAKQAGNTSSLLLNLLDMLPPDGSIRHQDNREVDAAIQAGEAAFARRDYDEALRNYSRAFQLDPTNYSAALFVADSYFAKKDFANARKGYDRAIQVNPDVETAYRYEADMLTRNGEMDKARLRSIQAVVAEPYNQVTWRGLAQWANVNHVQLRIPHLNTPSKNAQQREQGTQITVDAKSSTNTMAFFLAVWVIYDGVREKWTKEEFKKRFPGETQYRHSLAEESDALSQAAKMLPQNVQAKDIDDPSLALLKQIADANMIEPYVLLNAADAGIAQDYVSYRAQNRIKLEEYLSNFVVPPAPPKP
jgi:tetratricopeptide (TPR) repeat protein